MKHIDFILASSSPRRRELLEKIGVKFQIVVSDADERVSGDITPSDFVKTVSIRKGEATLEKLKRENCLSEDTLLLACDTVVAFDGKVIGKPIDEAHAILTLSLLSDSWHEVYSGISLYYDGRWVTEAVATKVKFRALSDEEIAAYVESGEPMGKAGSYAIQGRGASFAETIEGEYYNIVGLPLAKMISLLQTEFGIEPSDYIRY